MKNIYFPLENENPEILEYLLDTVLIRNGSVVFSTANGCIEVATISNPDDEPWWRPTTYIVQLLRRPARFSAKYVGIVTTDLDEVKQFILGRVEEGYHPESHRKTIKTMRGGTAYTKVKEARPEETL